MYRTWKYLGKMTATAFVLAAAGVFLVFMGPNAPRAYADIYTPLIRAAGLLPPPPGPGSPMRYGKALVNGQIFEYAIGHSKMRLDDALGYFERQFDTVSPGGGPISTASRFDFPDGGIVAGIQLGHVTTPDLLDRLRQFSASTELATLGNFHVVSAFSQDGTVFIDFMPARTVKLTGLLPHGPEDAAGEDVPGVRRPEHLQRVTTIEHGEGPAWSRTNVYRTADADAALAAFKREFNAAGWGSLAPPEAPVAHLSDGRGECFLGIAGHGGDGAVVVVYRTLSGSHKP